jgi:homogentisate 1,2-dioxygenase
MALPHSTQRKAYGTFQARRVPAMEVGAQSLHDHELALGQLRWNPLPIPEAKTDFIAGIRTMTTAGDVSTHTGMAAHIYVANADMVDDHVFNADGEMPVVPQEGPMPTAMRRHRRPSCSR